MNARSFFVVAALAAGTLVAGEARAGSVTPMPNALAFPSTGVGSKSASMNVQFTNTSGASVNIDTVVIGGANASDYQIVGNLGLPILLPPGVPLSVDVVFFPQTAGTRTATLSAQVRNQMGTTDVALTGNALGPKIVVKPSPIVAGGLPFGQPVPPLTITISNGGGSTLNIPSAPTITGINANLFSMSSLPGFPQALTPGVSFTFQITFTPMAPAKVFAILNVTSDDPNNGMLAVPITGLAGDPVVALDVGAVFFGNERVNQMAQAQTINISNTGLSDLHISAIAVIGKNAGDFPLQSSPKLPLSLPVGASQPITVTFAPMAAGNRSASIQISTDDPKTPQKLLVMTGTGTLPAGSIAPATVDFGNTRVGTSPTMVVTLTNTGTGPITVTADTLAGMGKDFYTVAPSASAMTPVVVPGMGHQDFTITYKPKSVAASVATLTFVTDDPNLAMFDVPIMGQGTSPVFGIMPMTLDFGSVAVGTMSPPKTFTIGNTGNADLTCKMFSIAGPSSTRFNSMMPQLPIVIPAGGSQVFSIVYGPLDPSSDNAVVNFGNCDDPNMMSGQVMLLGTGIQANITVTPPDKIDFGPVIVGGASMKALKIQNTGDLDLVISALKFMGMPGYTADTKTPITIKPQKTATVMILFQPLQPGTIEAMLEIDPMDQAIMPVTIDLTGVGTASMISVAPTMVDFGMVAVGTTAVRQEIKIFNLAGTAQVFAMPVSDDPHFALDLSGFSKTIAGGGISSVFVTFTPDAVGPISSRVKFALAASPTAIAAQAFVSGTGTPAVATMDMGMAMMPPARGCSVGGARGNGGSDRSGLAGVIALAGLALIVRRRRRSA